MTDGAVLISKGLGNPVEWRPKVIATGYLTSTIYLPRASDNPPKPLTMEIDTHNAMDTTTAEYTIPVSGVYSVTYSATFVDPDSDPNRMNNFRISIFIDTGSGFSQKYIVGYKNNGLYDDQTIGGSVSHIINFTIGDKVQCKVGYFSSTTTQSYITGGNSPAYHFVSIHLVG